MLCIYSNLVAQKHLQVFDLCSLSPSPLEVLPIALLFLYSVLLAL
jgi:hypothetical protein